MEINNKYNVGDELYTVVRQPIQYECYVCGGSGAILYNGYNVKCPRCDGAGKIHDIKTLWCVANEKVAVRKITVSICKDIITYKYKLNYSGSDCNIYNRMEDNLFDNIEEAQNWCNEHNNAIM